MTIENIAQVAYELNKTYSNAIGDGTRQPEWEDAPEELQQSYIKSVQFHLDNPSATPRESHNAWLKEKQEQGWQYAKGVKDATKKQHSGMVAFEQLHSSQMAKNYLFAQVVNSLKKFL